MTTQSESQEVCVIGMGYVGLTLAAVLADRGLSVTGVEKRADVAAMLRRGEPHFHEQGLAGLLRRLLRAGTLRIEEKVPQRRFGTIVLSVGTPIDHASQQPVLDDIRNAASEVAEVLGDGSLVICRSTVPLGATREIVKPLLEKSGKQFYLAFCPERTVQGRAIAELGELPQVVGGIDAASVRAATDFFRAITPTVVAVSSLEVAELTKLVNNSFRDVMFGFANEIAALCEHANLDSAEAIWASNLGYARSNVPQPGFVGGTCLRKDPHLLVHSCQKFDFTPSIVVAARQANQRVTRTLAQRLTRVLAEQNKDPGTARVLFSGLAFKGRPETDDVRDSVALELVDLLREKGYKSLFGHDFIVPKEVLERHRLTMGRLEAGAQYDAIVFGNNHPQYARLEPEDILGMVASPGIIVDVWNLFPRTHLTATGARYIGVGR